MNFFLRTPIGRLRLLGLVEGASLILLVFIGMPLKYWLDAPLFVKVVGPIHGFLFLAFVFYTIQIAVSENWIFKNSTWKVLVASVIPFATFYVDAKVLKKMQQGIYPFN